MALLEFLRRRWHRLVERPPAEVPPLQPVSFSGGGGLVARVRDTKPRLERLLNQNILPFWYPGCIDREDGGYRLNHDAAGRYKGPADKFLIPHAHNCWVFARMARFRESSDRETPGSAEWLAAARHGFEFLRDRLWDKEHGGFLWAERDDRKLVLGQVTGLFGVVEYAAASGEPGAREFADEVFALTESRCRDRAHGGYWSRFTRSWDVDAAAGGIAALKSANDHLHVLETYTSYADLVNRPEVRSRLLEVILIMTGTVLRKGAGASTNLHRLDWTPLNDQASYGHDLELAWLVLEACRAAELPESLLLDSSRSLVEHTLKWGWDRKQGGVYFGGPLTGPAHSREKVWWVQGEALVAALTMYQRTGHPRYAELYLSVLDWVERRQQDREGGDWHAIISPKGVVTGDKADHWKDAYHQARGMIMCLEVLKR